MERPAIRGMWLVREAIAALSQQRAVQIFVLVRVPRGRLQTLWALWRDGLGCNCCRGMVPPTRDMRLFTLEQLHIERFPFQKAHAVGGGERMSREHATMSDLESVDVGRA